MTSQKRGFVSFLRSLASWVMVGLVTIALFIPDFFVWIVSPLIDRDKRLTHPIHSLWAKTVLLFSPYMRVRVEGSERLEHGKAYVFVANHQSLADILVVLHLNHPFKFIAKKELFWIPFLGWALSIAGYIPLVRGNPLSGKQATEKARGYLRRGMSVLFFPEGTRSPDGAIHRFKVGAFKIALEEDMSVVPVVINGTRDVIQKGSFMMGRTEEVTIRIGDPIRLSGKDNLTIEGLSEKVRSTMIEALGELRAEQIT